MLVSKIKTPAIYMGANILSALVPFLLLPIMTTYLSPAEYGITAMFQVAVAIFAATAGISVRGNAVRRYYESPEDISSYLGSCAQLVMVFWVVNLFLVAIAGNTIGDFIGVEKQYLYLAVTCTSASMMLQLRLGQWQVRKKAVNYGFFQVIGAIANAGISVLLVVGLLMGYEGRIYGIFTSSVFMTILATVSLLRDGLLLFSVNLSHYKEILKFGLPLVPHVLAGSLMVTLDRYFILNFESSAAVGLYMVAVQFGLIISMSLDAINKYYVPVLFSVLSRNEIKEKISILKFSYAGLFALAIVGTILSFVVLLIFPYFIGESFMDAKNLIPWIILANCLSGIYFLFINYVIYAKKTIFVSLITMFSMLINLVLLLTLLPKFGVIGAAYALVATNLTKGVLAYLFARKFVDMPWISLGA